MKVDGTGTGNVNNANQDKNTSELTDDNKKFMDDYKAQNAQSLTFQSEMNQEQLAFSQANAALKIASSSAKKAIDAWMVN